jgi:hypothetical protein
LCTTAVPDEWSTTLALCCNCTLATRLTELPAQSHWTTPHCGKPVWACCRSALLVFCFIGKRQFAAKTDRNSVFLGREAHIPNWLYIMVLYNFFYRLSNIWNFDLKSNGVSIWFYSKTIVCGKNWPKLHISWPWSSYSRMGIHNGPIYKFLWVFKKFKFWVKI